MSKSLDEKLINDSYQTMSNITHRIHKEFFNGNSLLMKVVLAQEAWPFNIQKIEEINTSATYRIIENNMAILVKKGISSAYFLSQLENIIICINMLIYISQEINYNNIENYPLSQERLELSKLSKIIFSSDLILNNSLTWKQQLDRAKLLGEEYIKNRNKVPLNLIMQLCNIKIISD